MQRTSLKFIAFFPLNSDVLRLNNCRLEPLRDLGNWKTLQSTTFISNSKGTTNKVRNSEGWRHQTFLENAMKLKNSSIWSAPYRERIPSLLQHSHYAPISNWYGKDDSYTVREKFLNTEFFSGPYLDTFHAVLVCNSYIFLLKLHLLLFFRFNYLLLLTLCTKVPVKYSLWSVSPGFCHFLLFLYLFWRGTFLLQSSFYRFSLLYHHHLAGKRK